MVGRDKVDRSFRGARTRAVTRRDFLRLMGGTAVGLSMASLPVLGAGCVPGLGKPENKTIVMSMSGGTFMDNVKKYITDPFEQKTGAKVEMVPGAMPAHAAQLRASKENPAFDLFLGYGVDGVGLMRDGYFMQLTSDKTPNMKDVAVKFKEQWNGYAVAFDYVSFGIAYSPQAVKSPPKGWKEFVDRIAAGDFGKTAIFNNLPSGNRGPEIMLMLAKVMSGDSKNMDAAFQAVKRMKPNILKFYTSLNDPETMIVNGEATISTGGDGRIWNAAEQSGGKIAWLKPSEGAVAIAPILAVTKNGNTEWAYRLLDFAISAEPQELFGEAMMYGSVNTKSKHGPRRAGKIPLIDEVELQSEAYMAENLPAWVERWNKEIAS